MYPTGLTTRKLFSDESFQQGIVHSSDRREYFTSIQNFSLEFFAHSKLARGDLHDGYPQPKKVSASQRSHSLSTGDLFVLKVKRSMLSPNPNRRIPAETGPSIRKNIEQKKVRFYASRSVAL